MFDISANSKKSNDEFDLVWGAGAIGSAINRSPRHDRPLEILYIGDYDPSGMHMSDVDLPGRLERYGGDAKITRIALTEEVCTSGELPGFALETKTKDPRHDWFKQRYGSRCWELDAMNPNDLRDRLREEILDRIDFSTRGSIVKSSRMPNARASINTSKRGRGLDEYF